MKVKVISLPCLFQVLYVLCFTWTRYQVSVYRTIGPLVVLSDRKPSQKTSAVVMRSSSLARDEVEVWVQVYSFLRYQTGRTLCKNALRQGSMSNG